MIWTWLTAAFVFLAKLIIPAPPRKAIPQIDPNETCPWCGHKDGIIRADPTDKIQPLVEHICKVCGGHWHEKTVLTPSRPVLVSAQPKPELVTSKPA